MSPNPGAAEIAGVVATLVLAPCALTASVFFVWFEGRERRRVMAENDRAFEALVAANERLAKATQEADARSAERAREFHERLKEIYGPIRDHGVSS